MIYLLKRFLIIINLGIDTSFNKGEFITKRDRLDQAWLRPENKIKSSNYINFIKKIDDKEMKVKIKWFLGLR